METLIREGFLPPEAASWPTSEWTMANLSDTDPAETIFIHIVQSDNTILLIRKDGKRAVFKKDSSEMDSFAKAPDRDPAWLEK